MAGLAALLTLVWKVFLTMPAGQSPWHVLPSEVEVACSLAYRQEDQPRRWGNVTRTVAFGNQTESKH